MHLESCLLNYFQGPISRGSFWVRLWMFYKMFNWIGHHLNLDKELVDYKHFIKESTMYQDYQSHATFLPTQRSIRHQHFHHFIQPSTYMHELVFLLFRAIRDWNNLHASSNHHRILIYLLIIYCNGLLYISVYVWFLLRFCSLPWAYRQCRLPSNNK